MEMRTPPFFDIKLDLAELLGDRRFLEKEPAGLDSGDTAWSHCQIGLAVGYPDPAVTCCHDGRAKGQCHLRRKLLLGQRSRAHPRSAAYLSNAPLGS